MKYVILIGLIAVVVIEYACMVAAHRADEQAEALYRRYMESKKNDERESTEA